MGLSGSDNSSETTLGTVSSIEPQRRRGRVNVFVGGCFALGLSEAVAVRAGLRPGIAISQRDIDRLRDEDAAQVALDAALNFLSYRPRSERELRLNLRRKNIPDSLIDRAVIKLRALELLDDKAFARFWVAERDHFSPRGQFALRSELQAKGVARADADEAIVAGDDEETRARAIARRRLARLPGLDPLTLRKRLTEALIRRGFSYEIANRVVREVAAGSIQSDEDLDV